MVTVVCRAPKQGLLEVVCHVVDLSGDLPQQEGLREEKGPWA